MLMMFKEVDIYDIMDKYYKIIIFMGVFFWFMFSIWIKDKLRKLKEVSRVIYKLKENIIKELWIVKNRSFRIKE